LAYVGLFGGENFREPKHGIVHATFHRSDRQIKGFGDFRIL
jgi:hypothetical protein